MDPVVHILFYANMRTITGQRKLDIVHSNAKTLGGLIARLVERFPDMHQKVLDDQGNLRQDVPIFVNGRNPRLENMGFDAVLKPGDVISLFSPIASGRMNVEVMRPSSFDKSE